MNKDFNNNELNNSVLEKILDYKELFGLFNVPLAIVSVSGKLLKVNKFFCELLGYDENEIHNMNFIEFTHADDHKQNIELFNKLISHEISIAQFEKRYINKNGEVVWAKVTSVAVDDVFTNVRYIASMVEDITNNKKAELKLKDSELQYRYLAENIADVVWILDVNTMKFKYVSPSVFKLRGYTHEEVMRQSLDQVVAPESLLLIQNLLSKRIVSYLAGNPDTPQTTEVVQPCKDGSTVLTEVTTTLVGDVETGFQIVGVSRNISDRKKTEDALALSEEKMRTIVEGTPYLFFYTQNKDADMTYVSPTVEQITGYSVEKWLHTRDWFVTESKINQIAKERTYAHLRGEFTHGSIFVEIRHTNGNILTLEIFENPVFQNGQVVGLQGIAHDITSRKLAEEQVMLLSRAVEKSPATIIITDEEGHIEYVNNKFIELTGYSFEDVKGKKPSILKSGEKSQEEYKILWDTINSGKEWRGEFHNRKKSGELYWESAVIGPVKNGRTFFLAVKEDITSRKQNEEKLHLLSDALKSVSDCVSITDIDDNIIFVNESFVKTYGYSEQELIGKNISMVRSNPNNKNYDNILNTTLKGNWHGELLQKRKDGTEFPVHLSASPVTNNKKETIALIGIARDITERKKLFNELVAAKEKAEQSDKLKTEFLSRMSHEIRTPLNAMLSYTNLIGDEIDDKTQNGIDLFLSGIETAGKRIIRTIEQILNMSQLQLGQYEHTPKTFDLNNTVLESVFMEYQSFAKEKNLNFMLIKNAGDTLVNADEYSVNQIFENLIDNAIKFTHKGFVEIKIDRNKNGNLVVDVADSGIGISNDYLPKLYTPFSQEEQGYTRKFEGNGLGLALVKSYSDLNNIQIYFDSKKGKGSRFTLTFPKDKRLIP